MLTPAEPEVRGAKLLPLGLLPPIVARNTPKFAPTSRPLAAAVPSGRDASANRVASIRLVVMLMPARGLRLVKASLRGLGYRSWSPGWSIGYESRAALHTAITPPASDCG